MKNGILSRAGLCGAILDLDRDGACFHRGLATAYLDEFGALLAKWPDGRAGVRIAGDPELGGLLGLAGPIGKEVCLVLGQEARPVRAVLFDKNDAADWSLGWHQDRTIAVVERVETTGYGPWSVKQGITHVEPPFALI